MLHSRKEFGSTSVTWVLKMIDVHVDHYKRIEIQLVRNLP